MSRTEDQDGFEAMTLREIETMKRERNRLLEDVTRPGCPNARSLSARAAALTRKLKVYHRTLDRFRAARAAP